MISVYHALEKKISEGNSSVYRQSRRYHPSSSRDKVPSTKSIEKILLRTVLIKSRRVDFLGAHRALSSRGASRLCGRQTASFSSFTFLKSLPSPDAPVPSLFSSLFFGTCFPREFRHALEFPVRMQEIPSPEGTTQRRTNLLSLPLSQQSNSFRKCVSWLSRPEDCPARRSGSASSCFWNRQACASSCEYCCSPATA